MVAPESEKSRLDEAARAGWLYFIAGHTQDEIAKMLQVSRASAQRLVSLCLAERLITFRLEHPIAACMELASRLKDLFHLVYCEVVPTDPAAPLAAAGIAERAANILESMLRAEKPDDRGVGHGESGASRGRACFADRLPQSSDRVAGRKHLGRRLGEFLRYCRAARRSDQGAPLSHAAALSDVVGDERDQMLQMIRSRR